MPLQFQPYPGAKTKREIQDQNLQGVEQGIGGIGNSIQAYQAHKLATAQHELQMQQIQAQMDALKQETTSKYGTGAPAPQQNTPYTPPTFDPSGGTGDLTQMGAPSPSAGVGPGIPGTPLPETPAQQQSRIGTERFAQLHQPQYVAPGVDPLTGQPTFTPYPQGTKPGLAAPQPTTILSATGQNMGTVNGKPTVLPEAQANKEGDKLKAKLAAEKPKALGSLNDTLDGIDRMIAGATAIKNDPSLANATGPVMGRVTAPGGPTRVASALDTLKAQTLLNVLSSMKTLSSNGSSGFGQLSENEGAALKDSISSLNRAQNTEDFKASLDRITNELAAKRNNIRNTFISTYGDIPNQGAPHSPDERAAGIKTVNSQAEYDALPRGASYFDSHGTPARKP